MACPDLSEKKLMFTPAPAGVTSLVAARTAQRAASSMAAPNRATVSFTSVRATARVASIERMQERISKSNPQFQYLVSESDWDAQR